MLCHIYQLDTVYHPRSLNFLHYCCKNLKSYICRFWLKELFRLWPLGLRHPVILYVDDNIPEEYVASCHLCWSDYGEEISVGLSHVNSVNSNGMQIQDKENLLQGYSLWMGWHVKVKNYCFCGATPDEKLKKGIYMTLDRPEWYVERMKSCLFIGFPFLVHNHQ
jgi:hypothetical protein